MSTIPQALPTFCFCWGSGAGGALGIDRKGSPKKIELKPTALQFKSSLMYPEEIFAGYKRNVVVFDSGSSYSWGCGPLGYSKKNSLVSPEPRQIKHGFRLLKISHGECHSTILTHCGAVLVFGDASGGKLGLGKKKCRGEILAPVQVPFLKEKKCIDVSCSFYSTSVVVEDGSIVTFGSHPAAKRKREIKPSTFTFSTKMMSIASGTNHSVAISNDGNCFTWGLAENGRLGHAFVDDLNFISNPKCVEFFFERRIKICKVACGAAHTVCASDSSKLFSFGWNVYGQCGMDYKVSENVLVPYEIQFNDRLINQIDCGFGHSAIICSEEHLYTWGFNGEGQLGLGHEQNISHPSVVNFGGTLQTQNIISVSCGHTHCIAITSAYSKRELQDWRQFMKKKEKATHTLGKFSRHCLLRIRMIRFFHREKSPTPERIETNETISPSQNSDSPNSSQVSNILSEWETSTTLSDSLSSIEIIQGEVLSADIVRRSIQEVEVENMHKEDRRSMIIADEDRQRHKVYEHKKQIVLTEIIRQHEIHSMVKEDVMSHLARKAEREENRKKIEAKKRQRLKERNTKARERMKIEVDRLMFARTKKNNSSSNDTSRKGRKIRIIRTRRRSLEYEQVVESGNLDEGTVPDLMKSSDKLNKILLKKREQRLQLRTKEAQDEYLTKIRQAKNQNDALKIAKIKAKERFLQQVQQIQSELMRKNNITSIEQKEIEENLMEVQKSPDTTNNRNPKFFRSVSHWTQNLIG